MRVIVSDSSCLIDLEKGDLLELFVELPFEIVVPDVLIDDELTSLSATDIELLREATTVVTLDAADVERASAARREKPGISLNDAFALVAAEQFESSILLTGDRQLREIAVSRRLEVHGVLWVVEELLRHGPSRRSTLRRAVERWRDDRRVRLPGEALSRLHEKLKRAR